MPGVITEIAQVDSGCRHRAQQHMFCCLTTFSRNEHRLLGTCRIHHYLLCAWEWWANSLATKQHLHNTCSMWEFI